MSDMVRAAGVMITAVSGRVLLLKRADTGQWSFPFGHVEAGETAMEAAKRECFEEVGYLCGSLVPHTRRIKDGVDAQTFAHMAEEEFVPKLNGEHSAHCWIMPEDAIDV